MRRVAAVLVVLLAALLGPAPARSSVPPSEPRPVAITARDGVTLRGTLFAPVSPGPRPALVLVSPWGTPDTVYSAQATELVRRGYVVLSYTTRGFGASGGTVQLAGPDDIADVSTVLDWLIARTAADPARLGIGGISYGAGISLLAASHDPRIRAVVAMSGWTDLTRTFYRGGARAFQVLGSVRFFAEVAGRPSPELVRILADFFADRDRTDVRAWTQIRSADAYLSAVDTYRPAIFLAQAYGDSFFPPDQAVDFFDALTGPKRLELSPGDHGTPEASGLLGLPNPLWSDAGRWLDRYLAGRPTGIDREDPVVLRGTPVEPVETYPDWPHVGARVDRYGLGPVRDGTGSLVTGPPPAGWHRTIGSGRPTTADSGIVVITNGLAGIVGVPSLVFLPAVDRHYAGVWTTPPLDRVVPVRGMAHLRLEVRRQRAGTVFAYLYAVDPLGIGRLVAHQPQSWSGGRTRLDLRFPPVRFDLPAGSRLALVVDTVDGMYGDRGPRRPPLEFTGPSWVDLPHR